MRSEIWPDTVYNALNYTYKRQDGPGMRILDILQVVIAYHFWFISFNPFIKLIRSIKCIHTNSYIQMYLWRKSAKTKDIRIVKVQHGFPYWQVAKCFEHLRPFRTKCSLIFFFCKKKANENRASLSLPSWYIGSGSKDQNRKIYLIIIEFWYAKLY